MYLCIYVSMYLFIYVSMYLRIYVSTYLCIYVSMYLCIYVSMYLCIYVSMYSMYLRIYVSRYLGIYVSMYLCIYVSMYLCIYVYMHLCIYVSMYPYLPTHPPTYLPTYCVHLPTSCCTHMDDQMYSQESAAPICAALGGLATAPWPGCSAVGTNKHGHITGYHDGIQGYNQLTMVLSMGNSGISWVWKSFGF